MRGADSSKGSSIPAEKSRDMMEAGCVMQYGVHLRVITACATDTRKELAC